jgi:hypothetical protein
MVRWGREGLVVAALLLGVPTFVSCGLNPQPEPPGASQDIAPGGPVGNPTANPNGSQATTGGAGGDNNSIMTGAGGMFNGGGGAAGSPLVTADAAQSGNEAGVPGADGGVSLDTSVDATVEGSSDSSSDADGAGDGSDAVSSDASLD